LQLGNDRRFGVAEAKEPDFIRRFQGGLQLADNVRSDPVVPAVGIAEADDVKVP
jgi:hypothetical protein